MDNNELLEKDLKEEKRLFEQILQLSAQQVALFNPNQNNTDELLHNFNELLARRQTLMECVDDIEKRWDWQSESARAHQGVFNEIKMIIQLIRENDSRTIKEAEKKMKQISAKLNETRANQKAFNAYSQEEPYDGGYFVDRKN